MEVTKDVAVLQAQGKLLTENGIDRRSVWPYLSSLLANEILRQTGALECERDKSF